MVSRSRAPRDTTSCETTDPLTTSPSTKRQGERIEATGHNGGYHESYQDKYQRGHVCEAHECSWSVESNGTPWHTACPRPGVGEGAGLEMIAVWVATDPRRPCCLLMAPDERKEGHPSSWGRVQNHCRTRRPSRQSGSPSP
jgi:hypothetical protein